VADHEISGTTAAEDSVAGRNAHYGIVLFFVYFLFYAGFMALTAFYPAVMSSTPFGGVNLAILYGFGLIIAALVLALVYMFLCKTPSAPAAGDN
jgi:uncharacterized membrane protein (DUF485 family)